MPRLKKFTRSLFSGYLMLGVNIFYTLATVPLALHYLSKAEFGLWALTQQIAGFIALIDLGMSCSIGRILIDHKDDRHNGRYGGALQSGFLVGVAQGLIVLLVGLSLVWFMAGWLRVPPALAGSFFWLLVGQILLTAAMFGTRMLGQILYAWQRMDVINYSGIIQLAVGFTALWLGFIFGFGVYSLLAGAVASWLCGVSLFMWACVKLKFLPHAGEWGRASREQFRELFHYGSEVFLCTIGGQLIMSTQTMMISRQLGLESAALWAVMTKVFTLILQVISRVISSAMPAFAEMQVRGELPLLWKRYGILFNATNVIAGVGAVLFAACNGLFVTFWVKGKFSWPPVDNVLLGLWLIFLTQQSCHNNLIINLKEIRSMKYIVLLEGMVFVGVSSALLPITGITGMLICSLAATLLCTWLCGVWRIAKISRMGWRPLLWDWQKPLLRVLAVMVPVWLLLEWLLSGTPNALQLFLKAGLLAIAGVWAAIRFAMPPDLLAEVVGKLPKPLQQTVTILMGIIRCGQNPITPS